MELEEYTYEQNQLNQLFKKADRGDASNLLEKMIELEKNFFLEHLDLCEQSVDMERGCVDILGPNGNYVFSIYPQEDKIGGNLARPLKV